MKNVFRILAGLMFIMLSGLISASEINVRPGQNAAAFSSVPFESLTLTLDICSLRAQEVQTRLGYFTILAADEFGFSVVTGDPKLPVYRKLIQVPVNAGYEIQITYQHYRDINLSAEGINSSIIPAQAPLSKNITNPDQIPFVKNEQSYLRNAFNEDPLVTVNYIGIMRSVALARLDISPVQYNPVTGILRVYDKVEARITFTHPDLKATRELLTKYASPYYRALYSLIPNYQENADSLITSSPATLAIVAHPMFKNDLKRFIAWKTRKGFRVIAGYTDDPQVGASTSSIKNYLHNLYDNPPSGYNSPSFVLFVGDVGQIPAWNLGGHPSDMYYCDYTNDNIPEMTYGRFAAQNSTQLNAYIDKALEYEQYTMPSEDFLGEVVMVAGADASYGPTYGNGQINYGTINYFNAAHNLLSHTYLQPEPANGNYTQLIHNNVSNGVGFANYTAHGSESGWADPSFLISDIAALQNIHKYPLMVGNCCKTSNFSVSCFAKEITRVADKGALGYIGCSDYSYWDEDYWWACGYKALVPSGPPYSASTLGSYDRTFHDHAEPLSEYFITQGQMVQGGNFAVEQSSSGMKLYYWETYCLMGDPSLCIYYAIPSSLQASFNHVVLSGVTNLSVTTEPLAYVALSMNDSTLLDAKSVDSSGIANLSFPADTIPGYLRLIITKQNRKPLIDSVQVIPASGPYIVLQGFTVNDSTGGNNDHKADYNEDVTLNVSLQNIGVAASGNVNGTINTADTNVVISQPAFSFGSIPPGYTVTGYDAFGIHVKDNVPDQHSVHFNLALTDGSNNWTQELVLLLNAPVLNATNIAVYDPAPGGNGNGILDPGETATLKITTVNNGHASAVNATGHLAIQPQSAPFILVTNPNIYLGFMAPSAQVYAEFNVITNGITPPGTDVQMTYSPKAGHRSQYSWNKDYTLVIGQIPDVNMQNGSVTTCSSHFYDSGGPLGNYSNYENSTFTINPSTTGANVKISFSQFAVEQSANCVNDYLKVYDGASVSDPLLGTFCGNTLPPDMTATAGPLTFVFHSNSNSTASGWVSTISCSGGPLNLQANAFPPNVCLGSSSQLAAIPAGGTGNYTFQWSPSDYLDNPSAQFPVSTPTANVTYQVTVSDGVNSITSSPITVTVIPSPEPPVISMNGIMLESNMSSGNQWYLDGNIIPGANSQTYQPSAYGFYNDTYTDANTGCSSVFSNTIQFFPVGLEETSAGEKISIYPNPCQDQFTVAFHSADPETIIISLFDAIGKPVISLPGFRTNGTLLQTFRITTEALNPGIYYCRVQTGKTTVIKKVVVTR